MCKIAKLKLIFKKSERTDPKNYRPSLLPIVSKIIEKSIHIQTEDYLNKKKLIYMYQSGFRTNHSTDLCLAQLTTDFVVTCVNKQMHTSMILVDTNKDVTGEKRVRDDKGNLTISNETKLHAWKEHYKRLFNVEFPWDKNSLNDSTAVEGPAIFVTESIVTEVIKKMKQGKAGGPSGVIVEIIKPGGRDCYCDIRACKSIHI